MTKKQEDRTIKLDNEEIAKATFPIVISVSRSTDIPAFYADWFLGRLKKGYSAWTNPFNGKKSYVAYEDTRFIGCKRQSTVVAFLHDVTIAAYRCGFCRLS